MKNKIGGEVPKVITGTTVTEVPKITEVPTVIKGTKVTEAREVPKVTKEQEHIDIKMMITSIINTKTNNDLLNKLINYLEQIKNKIPNNFTFTKSITYIYNNIDSNQKQRDAYIKQLLMTSSLTNTVYAHEYTNKLTNNKLIIS